MQHLGIRLIDIEAHTGAGGNVKRVLGGWSAIRTLARNGVAEITLQATLNNKDHISPISMGLLDLKALAGVVGVKGICRQESAADTVGKTLMEALWRFERQSNRKTRSEP